jgi:hypothetical protein
MYHYPYINYHQQHQGPYIEMVSNVGCDSELSFILISNKGLMPSEELNV